MYPRGFIPLGYFCVCTGLRHDLFRSPTPVPLPTALCFGRSLLRNTETEGNGMKYDAVALGRRIAALRKNMNCSQMEFSEMLFVNQGYLSQIEIGHRKPSLELIVDIADLTGADMNYLVLGKGQSDSIKTERRTVIDMLNAIDERL